MNIDEIIQLIQAVSENKLTSFELEEGNMKLSLKCKKEQPQILTAVSYTHLDVYKRQVCTPTEAAVVAAVYSLIVSFATHNIKVSDIPSIIDETVKTTAVVMLIASASCVFGWILTVEQIPVHAAAAISSIVPNKIAAILLVNLLFLIVGMFMDGTASIIILTPILLSLIHI